MRAAARRPSEWPDLFRVLALALLFAAPALSAHPVSIIRSQALVHRDRMEVSIAVMPEDFLAVYGLFANGQSRISTNDIAVSAEKHTQYLLDGLVVRDAEGNRLAGRVLSVDLPILPAAGLPVMDLMATTIVYHVEYPLAKPPTHLTFKQHFGGDSVVIPSIVYLEVRREGLPPEPRFQIPRHDTGVTIAFNWNEQSRPMANETAAILAHEEEQREEAMGISSYSATYTFVYIQNEVVRVELLMPLLTLETWQPVPRTNADFIAVDEQQAARGTLEKFLTAQNKLRIDGVAVKPKLERLDFYGIDFKDFAMRAEPRRLSAWTARVGAILTYSTKGAPGHVELQWTLFNRAMPAASAVIFAYEQGARFLFSPATPVFTWNNPGAPPLPAVNAISTGEKSREAVTESLLRNVYRAFDYHDDSDIYDALARSVNGDLLADLYLKIKQGLILQEQGGAVARVQAVKVISAGPAVSRSRDGFAERVTWQVEGTVEHWGHIHTRVNEYAADFEIEPVAGNWKITGLNVSRQNQVKSAVLLRKL